MVRILLTGRTVRVCQYWKYGRGQGGCFWLGVDRQGRQSSKGVDYNIMTQCLIGFDRILIPSRYTFFSEAHLQRTSELSMLDSE
jgi:hypothetical protein